MADIKESKRPEKMSYEQLENVAKRISEQNKELYSKLQELNITNMFKRLDYLFKVVENKSAFDAAFTKRCVAEIESMMTLPAESKKEKAENDTKTK